MKVLMATMQLDIGGAETHIVELSKALARRGVEVFVASNGGAYVKELEDAGIQHFEVALNRKTPSALCRAYKTLEKIIVDYKIDIVHAHARIPGFLCGLLHKKLGFRFVTTAHWVFTTRFPLNLLTNWGQRSLAVSDDIKQYLIDNYGCEAENIRVTINGVDTDKFSDSIDYSDIAKEFNFGENRTRIVYVSRMDIDRSLAAHKLIEAVPKLYAQIPNLEVVIVGGGNDFDPIKAEADAINAQLGCDIVIVTGGRTDINKFVASADVFVGVSRAALEAMACKKPAIIAGNEGYIGIFNEDKLQISIDTNFCCRGCDETTTEKLLADLMMVLAPENEAFRLGLGEYSLNTVKKYYSVDTMADDALKMYISIAKGTPINDTDLSELEDIDKYLICGGARPMDVVISGYYGFRNSGDDSILSAMIADLKAACPNISITVLSKNPAETARIYKVNSIDRLSFIKIWRLFKDTKLLISGGGSLIQDVTSSKSLYYYLSVIWLAKLRRAKVMLYANGIGPVTKNKNIKYVEKTLKSVDYITLREQSSFSELKRFNIGDVPCRITADPVFAATAITGKRVDDALIECGLNCNDKFFVITIRDWQALDPDFEAKIVTFAKFVYDNYQIKPFVIPMQKHFDKDISKKLASQLNIPHGISHNSFSPKLLMGIVERSEFVLGMRLHALIYAVRAGVPVIALDYDPKVAAVMDAVELKFSESVSKIDTARLCSFAREILENHAEISAGLKRKSEEFISLAKENTAIAVELLKNI